MSVVPNSAPYVNPHCLKDNKPCNPDGYGSCTSCDEWAPHPGQIWKLKGGTLVRIIPPRDERVWAEWPDGSRWPTDMTDSQRVAK